MLQRTVWRDEYRSSALRRYYARRHGVRVGLYSYGCFDPDRVPRGVTIGRYCSFASDAVIVRTNHPLEALSTHPLMYDVQVAGTKLVELSAAPLSVEDDVWIGRGATVTPGCRVIGRGAVVGAGAVVTRDVPRYAVVAGAPARVLRYRFDDEVIAALERSEWWTLDLAELVRILRARPAMLGDFKACDLHEFARDAR